MFNDQNTGLLFTVATLDVVYDLQGVFEDEEYDFHVDRENLQIVDPENLATEDVESIRGQPSSMMKKASDVDDGAESEKSSQKNDVDLLGMNEVEDSK